VVIATATKADGAGDGDDRIHDGELHDGEVRDGGVRRDGADDSRVHDGGARAGAEPAPVGAGLAAVPEARVAEQVRRPSPVARSGQRAGARR
jgi:hypothetical protein